jgi:ubiquitin-protein ligase
MGVRDNRLMQELSRMNDLRAQSGFIDFKANGDPPDEYIVTYTCRGMVDPDKVGEEHVARIYLSADFPFSPPHVRFLSPSFHPNIAAPIQMDSVRADIQDLLRRQPDEATRQRVEKDLMEDEDLFHTRVCLDTLDHNWSPSITLDQICIELGEMIQYKRYNLYSPLNNDAVDWVVGNRHRLPVDSRSLLDLRALAGIRILSEMPMDIRILSEDTERG